MRLLLLTGTAGGFFILSVTFLPAQVADSTLNEDKQSSTVHDSAEDKAEHCHWLWRNTHVSGGQLTLPFKIRRSPENHTFRLTTDVTLGGYIGYTRKISKKKGFYVTVPLTAGLTFINLNSNNTSVTLEESDAAVIPGLTWSSGLIFQLDQYSFGLMLGKDYASEVGNQWQYHGKLWWSFGVGFVFLQ